MADANQAIKLAFDPGLNAFRFVEGGLGIRVAETPVSVFIKAPTALPADGTLQNGEITFAIDEAGNNVEIKVKESGGTVFTKVI